MTDRENLNPQELNENESIELSLLLEAIYRKYGYDFRNYGQAHVKRRIMHRIASSGLANISELQHKILYDLSYQNLILQDLSINVTEMFRDPTFYKAVRQDVIPLLKTYPFLKIWHAGCASGEEVYSMAIMLMEEGLYDRTQIYATDFNHMIVQQARQGIFPIDRIQEYTRNYQRSGGENSFSDYYTARYDSVIMDKALKKNVVFSDHNLVTDGVFGEMNMIVCRNVMIYFNRQLQNKVLKLFYDSLAPGGFLCLGSKESIAFTESAGSFEVVNDREKIYKRKYLEK